MEALLQPPKQHFRTYICPEQNQKPECTPKQEPVKVNNQTLMQGMKIIKHYQ